MGKVLSGKGGEKEKECYPAEGSSKSLAMLFSAWRGKALAAKERDETNCRLPSSGPGAHPTDDRLNARAVSAHTKKERRPQIQAEGR